MVVSSAAATTVRIGLVTIMSAVTAREAAVVVAEIPRPRVGGALQIVATPLADEGVAADWGGPVGVTAMIISGIAGLARATGHTLAAELMGHTLRVVRASGAGNIRPTALAEGLRAQLVAPRVALWITDLAEGLQLITRPNALRAPRQGALRVLGAGHTLARVAPTRAEGLKTLAHRWVVMPTLADAVGAAVGGLCIAGLPTASALGHRGVHTGLCARVTTAQLIGVTPLMGAQLAGGAPPRVRADARQTSSSTVVVVDTRSAQVDPRGADRV